MILRRKAISTKQQIDSQGLLPNQSPKVYFVALTSCDKYGRPEFPTCLFDASTKRSFKKGVQVITVHDLVQDFNESCIDWDGKSDLFKRSTKSDHKKDARLTEVFEEASRKLIEQETDISEFRKILEQNGINYRNAFQEALRRLDNPNLDIPDVYILLYSFILRHRNDHIFVDEFSILHSKSSKLKIFYFLLLIQSIAFEVSYF